MYTYQIIRADGSEGDTFEVYQGMADPPLDYHPETGERVQRVFQAPNISGKWSESLQKSQMSDANLERLGFTKYQKSGKGKYEKRAGREGPDTLSVD
jgi:predicted nucleic acid-binding Zn ribbon protein